jgi:DNA-binding winged helix-turn-helix (wHTH) protein
MTRAVEEWTALDALPLSDQVEHLKFVIDELTSPPPEWFDRTEALDVRFQPAERRILGLLMRRAPMVVSKEALFEAIAWDRLDRPSVDGGGNTVRVQVHNIRAKLRALECDHVETVHKIGYRWNPDLRSDAACVETVETAAPSLPRTAADWRGVSPIPPATFP